MARGADPISSNAAARTMFFLKQLESLSGGRSRLALSRALDEMGLGEKDSSQLALKIARLRMQAESVPDAMTQLTNGGQGFDLSSYDEILSAMKLLQNPKSDSAKSILDQISTDGWRALAYAAGALGSVPATLTLNLSARDQYLDEVRSLIDQIEADTSIGSVDRDRLAKLLGQVEEAFVGLEFLGVDSVKEASTAVRAVVGDTRLLDRIKNKTWFARFKTVVVGTLMVMGGIGGLPALGIELGGDDVPSIAVTCEQPDIDVDVEVDSSDSNGASEG